MIDHDKNLITPLERCREKNSKLDAKKMKLRLSKFPYIRQLLTAESLEPDQNKFKAIL